MNLLCIVDHNDGRSVALLDHFRNFRSIQLIVEYNIKTEEGILKQGKGYYCSKLKKGKLKTKNSLKFTRCIIRWTRFLSTISRACLKLTKYVFTKTWKSGRHSSIHISLKINKNSGFHVRKYAKQHYLKVVQILFSLVILHSAKSAFMLTTIQPR